MEIGVLHEGITWVVTQLWIVKNIIEKQNSLWNVCIPTEAKTYLRYTFAFDKTWIGSDCLFHIKMKTRSKDTIDHIWKWHVLKNLSQNSNLHTRNTKFINIISLWKPSKCFLIFFLKNKRNKKGFCKYSNSTLLLIWFKNSSSPEA